MALGTDQMTVTTLACFIPEWWGPDVIEAFEANTVLKKLVWDVYKPGKTRGDTIHLPNISRLTTTAKAANTEVTLSAPTETAVSLVINRYDHAAFLLERIADVQSSFDTMKYYTEKIGYAVARQIDTRISTLFSGFSQIQGSAGVDLGDEQVRGGVEFLDRADAPDIDRHFVMFPDQKNAIMSIEKYFRADMRGDGASKIITKGQFGDIYGVKTYVTTNLSTSAGARLNAMFYKQAIAHALQEGPMTRGDYVPEQMGTLVVGWAIYGEVEARDASGVWMQS